MSAWTAVTFVQLSAEDALIGRGIATVAIAYMLARPDMHTRGMVLNQRPAAVSTVKRLANAAGRVSAAQCVRAKMLTGSHESSFEAQTLTDVAQFSPS
jgi:hypothetical protein